MLVTPADFTGEFRLHNVNNLNPDLVQAIDENQALLTRDLFDGRTAAAIIANAPTVSPNTGLRGLGLDLLYLSWLSLRIQMPVLAAGVVQTDFPALKHFASGNFAKISSYWRMFLERFAKFRGPYLGTAVAVDTIRIPDDDPIWSGLVYANSPAIVSGIGQVSVLSVATTAGVGTDFTLSVSTLSVGASYSILQRAVVLKTRDFTYF